MPDLLDFALSYAVRGWRVLLLQPGEKRPFPASHICSGTSHGHGHRDAMVDLRVVRTWWGEHPTANIGIATGRESGLFVVDEDPRNGGEETLAALVREHNPWPRTPTVRTGGGGHHFLFRYPAGADLRRGKLGPGIDLKHDGGYIVAAGSVHPNGTAYRWEEGLSPDDVPLARLPGWLLSLMASQAGPPSSAGAKPRKGGKATEPQVLDPTAPVRRGERHRFLSKTAALLRFHQLDEAAITRVLRSVRDFHCELDPSEPMTDGEVAYIARSAVRDIHAPAKTTWTMQLADALLARFLSAPMRSSDFDGLAATLSLSGVTARRVLARLKRARVIDCRRVSVGGEGGGYWEWGLLDDVGFSGRPLADPVPNEPFSSALLVAQEKALRIVAEEMAAYRLEHGIDLYPRAGRFMGFAEGRRLFQVLNDLRGNQAPSPPRRTVRVLHD